MPFCLLARATRVPVVLLAGLTFAASLAIASDEAANDAALELGKEVFLNVAAPPCGVCHVLADAEAAGTIAPSLDELQPTFDEVHQAMTSGPGAMPDYSASLSDEEIDAVAAYVSAVAGGN